MLLPRHLSYTVFPVYVNQCPLLLAIQSQLFPPSDHLYVAAIILLHCWKQMIITRLEIPLI